MNRLSKIIKKATGITLAFTMVTSSISVMAAPSECAQNMNSDNNQTVVLSDAQPEVMNNAQPEVVKDAQAGSVTDTRLTWGAIEDIVNVSEPSGMSVTYLDNGITRTRNDCKEFSNNMSDGWYVLSKDVTTSDAVVTSGKVNLILKDNTTLNANNGIYVTQGSELIIWAQSNIKDSTTGKINAKPENGPGIGSVKNTMGGDITINGGRIEATGGDYGAGIGGGRGEKSGIGNITINSGFITAQGGKRAAGIGKGQQNNKGGTITINGGEVNTTGGKSGAGIGGGEDRGTSNVIINGGIVNIKGGEYAAGIGGGEEGDQDNKVTINGGTVNAKGYVGIGAGDAYGYSSIGKRFNGAEVEINGGTVTTNGIGGGSRGTNGPITINGGVVNSTTSLGAAIGSSTDDDQRNPITINGGVVNAKCESGDAAIGAGEDAETQYNNAVEFYNAVKNFLENNLSARH